MNIPSPSLTTITMKPPTACSIPHLLDVDPFEDFEFSFPCEDMWWDSHDTSDYFSDDDEDYSAAPSPTMLDISFQSTIYSLTSIDEEEEEDDNEGDVLIQKVISTISHVSPSSVYKRQKAAMKRRRNRRRRKKMKAVLIEPELRSLWYNSVGDLFAPSAVSKPPPTPNLPTINLSQVNKQMLRRLPDVVYLPIHSCSPDPSFYERNVPIGVHDTLTSAFWKEKPFGALPAIRTNLGPVSPPTDACYGYVWTEDGWLVKAECARVPDPGGGHVRGGRDREEDGRRRQKGRK